MLVALHLKQFVTFEELHLFFGEGLHVLTGESGAGKSVILDGLQLLLGQRGSSDYVRYGADKSQLEAYFTYTASHPLRTILQASGIEEEQEDEKTFALIIQRELTRQGRSICRVNGHLVPLSLLRQLGELLVNAYRQHESQHLLGLQEQRQWLDRLLPPEAAKRLQEYRRLWHERRRLLEEYRLLQAQEKQMLQQQDLYRYQLEEIRAAALAPDEEERLTEEQKILAHAEKISHTLNRAYYLLAGDGGVTDRLGQALNQLQSVTAYDQHTGPLVELLQQSFYTVEEATMELRRRKEQVYSDPHRLEQIEERIALIQHLKRKYGDTIPDVLAYAEKIEHELHKLEHREERLQELKNKLDELENELYVHASALSKTRQRLAQTLTPRVQQELDELQLENFRFYIQVVPRSDGQEMHVEALDANGIDDVQFLAAPNGSQEPLPLARVASGGELSRLMLALKTVVSTGAFTVQDESVTIVFDEIDTGVSGQSALSVAEKLHHLSRHHQILCISHQPQVVAMADHHYWVYKEGGTGAASRVQSLDWEARIQALARMMEGERLSDLTLAHAENMLRRAQEQKARMEKEG